MIGLTKAVAVGGVLGAAWAAYHAHDEIYQDASPELKGTHFVTTIGNKIFVIPKPFELSLGFTAGEFASSKADEGRPARRGAIRRSRMGSAQAAEADLRQPAHQDHASSSGWARAPSPAATSCRTGFSASTLRSNTPTARHRWQSRSGR
jgi:hypothetical protein